MDKLWHCILTGIQFEQPLSLEPTEGTFITYDFLPVGKVKISHPTLLALMEQKQFKNPVLAGICRNASENGQEPPMITTEFIQHGIKNMSYPKSFKEKCRHLLKYIYDRGGIDFKFFTFNSIKDYPICYSDDHEDFKRIMEYLEDPFQFH